MMRAQVEERPQTASYCLGPSLRRIRSWCQEGTGLQQCATRGDQVTYASPGAASPGVPRRRARTPRCTYSGGPGPCGHGYGHAHSAYPERTWWWHTAGWLAAARSSHDLPYSCKTYLRLCLILCYTYYYNALLYLCHTLYKPRQSPR